MNVKQITPILNVSSVPDSIRWFEALGWKRGFVWNESGMIEGGAEANASGPATFGSICCGETNIFLCKDGQGSRGGPAPRHATDDTGGVWMSWWVETPAAVDAAHALAVRLGFTVLQPPTDEPWGVREFHLCHPDGHTFRVSSGRHD